MSRIAPHFDSLARGLAYYPAAHVDDSYRVSRGALSRVSVALQCVSGKSELHAWFDAAGKCRGRSFGSRWGPLRGIQHAAKLCAAPLERVGDGLPLDVENNPRCHKSLSIPECLQSLGTMVDPNDSSPVCYTFIMLVYLIMAAINYLRSVIQRRVPSWKPLMEILAVLSVASWLSRCDSG